MPINVTRTPIESPELFHKFKCYIIKNTTMDFEQLKKGWDDAANNSNVNAAIHPAGNQSHRAYYDSGVADVNTFLTAAQEIGIDSVELSVATLLEFGCGNGRMTMPLSQVFDKVYAVDISYAMLQQLPKKESILPVLSRSDSPLLLPELADIAVSLSVFIHNTKADGLKDLINIAANLKEGAYAFLQIPIYEQSREPTSWTDVGVWTTAQLITGAGVAGFEVILLNDNPGIFSFSNIGANHAKYQVLRKTFTAIPLDEEDEGYQTTDVSEGQV